MAKRNPEPSPAKKNPGLKLKRVTTTYVVAGGAHREPPKLTIGKRGACRTNTGATGLFIEHLDKFPGLTRDNMKVSFGADPETGNIGIYLELDGPGVMGIRDWGNNLGLHLGGVFKDYPMLRPNTTVEAALRFDYDAEGEPCFAFNINSALAKKREGIEGGRPKKERKRRTRRKKGETATKPDTEPKA